MNDIRYGDLAVKKLMSAPSTTSWETHQKELDAAVSDALSSWASEQGVSPDVLRERMAQSLSPAGFKKWMEDLSQRADVEQSQK